MNNYVDLTILLVVSFLLFTRPTILVNFSNTFVGKLILIMILIATTLQSTISGIFVAILIIVLAETVYEGMENQKEHETEKPEKETFSIQEEAESEKEQYKKIVDMREKHCKSKKEKEIFVDAKGNELSLEEIKQKYPAIEFKKEMCNPCDESCSFEITGTLEQMTTQEALRPKNSKQIKITK